MFGKIIYISDTSAHVALLPNQRIATNLMNIHVVFEDTNCRVLGEIDDIDAEKIKVSILDQNDTFVALKEGSIGADMDVITSYSKEIEQGDIVRLTEE